MKKKLLLLAFLILLLSAVCVTLASCQTEDSVTLYVYNWGEYMSDGSEDTLDVNKAFEEYCKIELGINVKVNYSTYSSNEDMYAKISSGAASYDVIIPSDYMIERMVSEEMLAPLDLSKIPNYANIDDRFKGENIYYECGREALYSVPYFYGMVGIIYNTSIVEENDPEIGSWKLMWDEQYKGDILQFNNSRDAFGTALYALGYDVNYATEEQWREALSLLIDQKEIVQGYVMDEIFNKMQSGSAAVASYYAGDFISMYEDNEDLAFFYPSEGTNIYIDAMCIPNTSQNYDLAHEYINFMCCEEVGVANAEYTYYASPLTTVVENQEYREYMQSVNEDALHILYGQMDSVPSQAYLNLSPERLILLNSLWEELKVESSIGMGIVVCCTVIIVALILLAVSYVIKKRRWARLYD